MVDTIVINFKSIRDLELIAHYELPENRRNIEIVSGEELKFFYDSVDSLELALMNPRRMAEIEQLSSQEVVELFLSWVFISSVNHDVKINKQRKKDRRMTSFFRKFTNWLGLTKAEPVNLPELPKAPPTPPVVEKPVVAKKKPAPKKVALKLDAKDGDGDGVIQDGTIHERKVAPKKKPTEPKKK